MDKPRLLRFDIDRDVFRTESEAVVVGAVVPFGRLRELVRRSETTFVVPAAVEMLARRDHSRTELSRKLRRRGFSAAAVEGACDYVLERGYLDDRRFAVSFIRSAMRGAGRSRAFIEAKLNDRGLPRELIDSAIDEYTAEHPRCFEEALERHFERVVGEVLRKRKTSGSEYGAGGDAERDAGGDAEGDADADSEGDADADSEGDADADATMDTDGSSFAGAVRLTPGEQQTVVSRLMRRGFSMNDIQKHFH